jgi:hypothetical protein
MPSDAVICDKRCLALLAHPPAGKATQENMKRALVIALLMLFATPAWSQDVQIKKNPPAAPREERDVIPPALRYETRPSDADRYLRGGQVQYDPAFIGPLSKPYQTPTSTGRFGIAGWVSPHTPVGSPPFRLERKLRCLRVRLLGDVGRAAADLSSLMRRSTRLPRSGVPASPASRAAPPRRDGE